jgi:hypothetical protein
MGLKFFKFFVAYLGLKSALDLGLKSTLAWDVSANKTSMLRHQVEFSSSSCDAPYMYDCTYCYGSSFMLSPGGGLTLKL